MDLQAADGARRITVENDLSYLGDDEFDGDGEDFLDQLLADGASKDPAFLPGVADIAERQRIIRWLVQLRKDSGASQTRIADAMGTTQSAVSDLESGGNDVYLSTLQRYARAVGAPLSLQVQCHQMRKSSAHETVMYLNEWSYVEPALAGAQHRLAKGA